MATRAMPCIICGGPTSLKRGGGEWVKSKGALVRVRTCDVDASHRFETAEQPATIELLQRAEVVGGVDGARFDRRILANDIDYAVGKSLTEGQQLALVRRLARQIVLKHYDASRARELPPGVTMRLTQADIRDIVSETLGLAARDRAQKVGLRRAYRRAHMLYVLARGSDGSALANAQEVLDWLREAYGSDVDPDGRGYQVRRHYHGVREDRWLPLRSDAAPEPTHVVFLKHTMGPAPRPQGPSETPSPAAEFASAGSATSETPQVITMIHTRVPYDRTRLQRSIRHALAGVHDHHRISQYVLQWVLWSLAGQAVVRQADLGSQVAQCLRRVNEVAYLRWVIHFRDLDVRDVWNEALGLLAWPSPRLVFAPVPEHDPQRNVHVMPLVDPDVVAEMPPWPTSAEDGQTAAGRGPSS